MEKGWPGLPFRPISEFYRSRFGEKVYKVPVSTAEACPNRLGIRGMKTCSFCDVWGSAARAESLDLDLKTQVERYTESIGKRFNAKKFLIYFQAYTSTLAALAQVRTQYELALSFESVVGIVIGTRPDCLSHGLIQLWKELLERTHVGVELGVQSFSESQLLFLQRGHTVEESLHAIEKLGALPRLDLGIHLMFGLPGETIADIRQTARLCNSLPITNVKLHNLHVLKNTELEKWYHAGDFQPVTREEYAERVAEFLSHLSPRIFVHRLAAFSSRFDELVAPAWTSDKMGTHQFIVDQMRDRKIEQGLSFDRELDRNC